ncbi:MULTISPECIES: hypothetical protein [unclassified Planococcus (in: firmicutes)]|uniref:hypothetical protein n=1 Tax=unclassified Planococcus (in: firmicutes) TaxID=2662419 RepID=UPI000C7A4CA3|nr:MULTISPECIES: hypothetical protein [unclassified Planococcus (in: firmicutes)]PKG46360.1 hypothetical protein CXF66_08235 [Planococcus sp. Urea-trap-24]PKG90146.1 hypothetical protein CXF91_04580 [Planococcus sp. Urea-3u-39]
MDTYVESTIPLFMSDEQIINEVNHFSIFIKDLDHDISIKSFLQRLDELASIAEKTNLNFKYSVDEVVDWMNKNKDFSINYDDIHFENLLRRESSFINEVILKLQTRTKSNYRNHLLKIMAENTRKQNFTDTDTDKVNEFKIFFYKLKNDNSLEKESVITEMKNNKWFLPLPLGEITHSHWSYCHEIFQCIAAIGYREEDTIIRDAIEYFNEEIDNHPDEIFKYRLRHLIKQYLKAA